MTRINVIPPNELTGKHLVAEYREIMRLPGNLRVALNRKSKPFTMAEIPPEYVLGPGHVKFFFDKMQFLHDRFISLIDEMTRRGFTPKFTDPSIFLQCPDRFKGNYTPTEQAMAINRARIADRLADK